MMWLDLLIEICGLRLRWAVELQSTEAHVLRACTVMKEFVTQVRKSGRYRGAGQLPGFSGFRARTSRIGKLQGPSLFGFLPSYVSHTLSHRVAL